MIHKRPYVDDSQEFAWKHPRQCEDTSHFASIVNVHPNNAFQNHQISGKWEDIYAKHQGEGRFFEDQCNNFPSGTNEEYRSGASDCSPPLWWVNSNVMDADTGSEVAFHLPLFPEYFPLEHQIQTFLHSDDKNSSLLSPTMVASVGPEYQADIPEWSQQDMKSFLDCPNTSDPQVSLRASCAGGMIDDDYGNKMMGTCVIPMPDSEGTSNFHSEDAGHGINCECLDRGSIRCTGQHVTEAREKLRESLGSEIFVELGFCDMGEEVAKRWTEEEELAFDNGVLSNPFSLGKSFWDHLLAVLPSRTKKDLVSYYFNVFMLRKRADQNRVDPVYIDSDDDEWQTPEIEIPAGNDDSVVESPADHGAIAHHENNNEENCNENTEDGVDSSENVADGFCKAVTEEEDEGDIDAISRPHAESYIGNYSCIDFQLVSNVKGNNEYDYDDNQDDSCTSYEYQREQVDCHSLPEM